MITTIDTLVSSNISSVTADDTPSTTGLTVTPNRDHLRTDLMKYSKIASLHVATSLSHSDRRSQAIGALQMVGCGRLAKLTNTGTLRPLNRCHQRSCPICAGIRGRQYTHRVTKALDNMTHTLADESAAQLMPDTQKMIGLKITLNSGEACELINIRTRLTIMHSTWTRLLRTSKLKDVLLGALRSTEITQCSTSMANPHMHCLIMLPLDSDVAELENHIRRYWSRTIRKAVKKAESISEHNTSASVGAVGELYRHSIQDCQEWINYSTKGSYDLTSEGKIATHSETSSQFWIEVDRAIKGLRLISTSGQLKAALALVKSEEKESPRFTDGELPTPTHEWSHRTGSYTLISEITHGDTNPFFLSQASSYLRPSPLFSTIATAEVRQALNDLDERALRSKMERALNSGSHDTIKLFTSLFISSSSKVSIDGGGHLHHSESPELDRPIIKVFNGSSPVTHSEK